MTARSAFIGSIWLARLFVSKRAREELREASASLHAANIEVSAHLARIARERAGGAHARPTLRVVKDTRA